ATPVSYRLIRTTVCEDIPRLPLLAAGGPSAAPAPPDGAFFPGGPGGEPGMPFLPPGLWPEEPGGPIDTSPPGFPPPPPTGPPTEPPVVPPGPPTEPPVTAVPEPGTWALMILGFGLIGARLRRRVTVA
ncbi:MAG: PEPxxWA-CTERM sorting domain-containing protein, partial [Phenylobacterium sp.]|nr:PEPxxWA-CTERM sorting domain-containing protein [Phenylobacterium sp.]